MKPWPVQMLTMQRAKLYESILKIFNSGYYYAFSKFSKAINISGEVNEIVAIRV